MFVMWLIWPDNDSVAVAINVANMFATNRVHYQFAHVASKQISTRTGSIG